LGRLLRITATPAFAVMMASSGFNTWAGASLLCARSIITTSSEWTEGPFSMSELMDELRKYRPASQLVL
jgi:hypothetical protein